MNGTEEVVQGWIEQIEFPAWLDNRHCTRSEIFSRISSASAEERYHLFENNPREVMAILKWEATMDSSDRIDMELFGFLYCHDDNGVPVATRQDQLLRAIERWNTISQTAMNPFVLWQAYLKTKSQFTLLSDQSIKNNVEGNAQ